jgi:hypothetical protein
MIVSRRILIAGSSVAFGAIALMPFRAGARATTLHIHDSRLPHIAKRRNALATHDIAEEEAQLWRTSRTLDVTRGDIVTGETRWSDWVALRGLLAEHGMRERTAVLHETVVGTVVVWEMS